MQLRKSERKQAKIKIGLQGPSGSGKTMSALLLAKGLVGDYSKIAIIDTENGSADLYSHLGDYNVIVLKPPFSPDKYIKAIGICENEGMEAIIIDSFSHCWNYLLDYHSSLTGNSFTNWAKIKPLETAFIDKILQSPTHIISNMRVKQDYVLNEKNGKFIPEKVGLKAIQRDGVDYEFAIVFDIDQKHHAIASKDRTGLFSGKPEFQIGSTTGEKIKEWCESGTTIEQVKMKIKKASSLTELKNLFNTYKSWYEHLEADFSHRKTELELFNQQKHTQNGTTTN